MRKFSDLSEREDGFTLIELLVVIIIIGILAAIAIPLFLDQRKLAVDASVKSDVRGTVDNIVTAQAVAVSGASASYTAAVSTGNTLTVTGSTTAAATLTPAANTGSIGAGESFTVSGYNTGGKLFTGTGATFKYDSTTGQFGAATSV